MDCTGVSEDAVNTKTFWSVISAACAAGLLIAGAVWASLQSHSSRDYHPGLPIYVEQRVQQSNRELLSAIKDLRIEIQALRETLVAQGLVQPR